MPTSTPSTRKAAPRQMTAKRRESIAAFEQWQRNWSTSVRAADADPPAKRPSNKHADAQHSPHPSR